MLALLNYIQSLLGKRNLIAFVVLATLCAIALELTGVARNAFETYIQKQNATYAEPKAKGEADVATATAREKEAQAQLAAEVAANAKFRQLAEAQLAEAGAREKEFQAQLAAEVAANAKFRQLAEAQLAQASAREKEAMAFNAREVARNSAERQRAEALKASADADAAESSAAIQRTLRNIIAGEVAKPQERMRAGINKAFNNDPSRGLHELTQRSFNHYMNGLGMGDDEPAPQDTGQGKIDYQGMAKRALRHGLNGTPWNAPLEEDTGQIVRRMEGAISDPFDYSVKPRKTRANTTAPQDNGAKSFGELTDRSIEALHYRVDGDKLTASRTKQIEEDCKRRLAGFTALKGHAAIAVTPDHGCAWVSEQPTKQAALTVVMNQCAKAHQQCSIYSAR
jgi:hypothetical protein